MYLKIILIIIKIKKKNFNVNILNTNLLVLLEKKDTLNFYKK